VPLLTIVCIATHYTQAVKESVRARKKNGMRIFEGIRLIEDAIKNGFTPEELLMTATAVESRDGMRILHMVKDKVRYPNIEVMPYCVDDDLLSSLSETVHSQSMMALFKVPIIESPESIDNYFSRKQEQMSATGGGSPAMVLLCDHVSDPGNFGTLVRSSLGFGAQSVISIGGCDPWAGKTVRATMGACLNLPIIQLKSWSGYALDILQRECEMFYGTVHDSADELVIYTAAAEATTASTSEETAATAAGAFTSLPYDQADFTVPFVLVIGSEAHGISPQVCKKMFYFNIVYCTCPIYLYVVKLLHSFFVIRYITYMNGIYL
jgi:TrmH family RNA methyltransferase